MEKLEQLKKQMFDAFDELENFKKNNSTITGENFREVVLTAENYQEYEALNKKVKDAIDTFENNK